MSFLGRFVGGGGNGAKEERGQKIEAIERLCNTLKHASLLEDRRAAAQSLESASKHYRLVSLLCFLGYSLLNFCL